MNSFYLKVNDKSPSFNHKAECDDSIDRVLININEASICPHSL